jgi:hypothetical protein
VPMLNEVNKLFVRSNYNFEHTSYLNSYCRCLPNWSHYQCQQVESVLVLGSPHTNSERGGRNILRQGKSHLTAIGNFLVASRHSGFLPLWKRCVGAVGSFFSGPDEYSQLAEESAQSCLEGLSRFAVTGEARLELKPPTERPIVRLLEHNRPLLLSSGMEAWPQLADPGKPKVCFEAAAGANHGPSLDLPSSRKVSGCPSGVAIERPSPAVSFA